jgi:hypothetical protein
LDIQTSIAAMRSGTKQYSAGLRFIPPRRSFGDATRKASWHPDHFSGRGSAQAGKMYGGGVV